MKLILPPTIRQHICDLVFKMADAHGYLTKDRRENGHFMEVLIQHPEIGGQLALFMPAENVKTYIKDGILNRYAKVKGDLPRSVDDKIKQMFGCESDEIEFEKSKKISLHHLSNGEYVVAARTKHLKWETGLRKLILFVASKKKLIQMKDNNKLKLVLLIVDAKGLVSSSDKQAVNRALKLCEVRGVWM